MVGGVALLAIVAAAYAVYLHRIGFFAADRCLDDGGSYHYDRGECSLTDSYRGDVPPLWPF
ncbi:hypothetical protein J4558_20250 [Leptolyngbya sp. 15MV]|nr:hypothetical protein J4558_20250 [Leptolyngbya sp. 15MV]